MSTFPDTIATCGNVIRKPLSSNRAPQGVGDADLGDANRYPASTRHQDPC